ncbi:MAG: leucyl aminopeptidase [Candidatus Latescibacterota bacterium]|nr:leucyl aminopeptidase [Candidatus Latescibacterota bacterium]
MNITVRQGEIQKSPDQALIVNLFQGTRPGGATGAVDKELASLIARVMRRGDFNGERNQTLLLYTGNEAIPAERVIVVGLGKKSEFDLEAVRQAAGTAALKLQLLGVESASSVVHGAGEGGIDAEAAAQALAEGSALACYRFDEYRSTPPSRKRLKKITVVEFDKRRLPTLRRGVKAGLQIAAGVELARDLINHPGNAATPTYLASQAHSIARRFGMRCQVIDESGMKRIGMGALLGVTQGSAEPAKFIVLEHNRPASRSKRPQKPLVFVGKGVTFDSGGISIKSGTGMAEMKDDMSGAAAVLGAMQAVATLKLSQYVVGIVPATENLLDGKSYKPGDVLTTMVGKTIEIDNTDAEGRLILADALSYAQRFEPAGIVDLATLTGACVTALGHHGSGLMSNDDRLAGKVEAAASTTGEKVWRLPMWPEYTEQIKSTVADIKNTGGRPGGALTAAALLAEFVGDYPWVHLDIAGTAFSNSARPYIPRGGVGVGVRTLVQLARTWTRR